MAVYRGRAAATRASQTDAIDQGRHPLRRHAETDGQAPHVRPPTPPWRTFGDITFSDVLRMLCLLGDAEDREQATRERRTPLPPAGPSVRLAHAFGDPSGGLDVPPTVNAVRASIHRSCEP